MQFKPEKMQTMKESLFSKNLHFYYLVGLFATFAVTLSEVLKWKQKIYFVYSNATRDYWNNINPYDIHWAGTSAPDEFLYGPLFNFLFLPFSLMPDWIGPFLWNIFSYSCFFYVVFNLPNSYSEKAKKTMWLYMLPLLLNNLMYYQYNVLVAAFFLYAFSEMEKRGFLKASFVIAFSTLTKIYGGFQYVLFLVYEKPFKYGFKYMIPSFLLLFCLPVLHHDPFHLLQVYQNWLSGLFHHANTRTWQSVFYIKLFFNNPPENTGIFQLASGLLVILIVLLGIRKKADIKVRTGLFAILLGWMILFSSAPEISTYLIAISGYLIWYTCGVRSKFEKVLFWLNFILLIVVPQDIICPKPVMRLLIYRLNLNLIVFFITWISIVTTTLKSILFDDSSDEVILG